MKKSIFCISVLTCVVLLVGFTLTDGHAGTSNDFSGKPFDYKTGPKVSKDVVVVTGTVSGSLDGRLRLGNREVMVSEHTGVYKNGKGMIDTGTFLTKAPVYIIGVLRDGVVYAQLVIVSDSKKPVKGGPVRKLGPDEPL
jgi:hypothetical protein